MNFHRGLWSFIFIFGVIYFEKLIFGIDFGMDLVDIDFLGVRFWNLEFWKMVAGLRFLYLGLWFILIR